jgi:hypothetical protein
MYYITFLPWFWEDIEYMITKDLGENKNKKRDKYNTTTIFSG